MKRFAVALFLVLAVVGVEAQSPNGTISVAWEAVPDSDVAKYRIGWGTRSAIYDQSVLVPSGVLSYTILGLEDCRFYFVAVKAVDAEGNESEEWSEEVFGWPAPRISLVAPGLADRGRAARLTISGANFAPDASLSVQDASVLTQAVNSCTSMTADISTVSAAPVGQKEIVVRIGAADGSGKRVAGSAPNLFRVSQDTTRPSRVSPPIRGEAR